MSSQAKAIVLSCSYCMKALIEPEMYSFRGWVGCEQCIRDYHHEQSTQELEFELRKRHTDARAWIAKNRKALEQIMAPRRGR